MLKTFLKHIKTIFGLNWHTLTHNLCFGALYVKISIFCENHEFLGSQQINRKLQRITTFYVRMILLSEINLIHKLKPLKYFINLSYFQIKKFF